MSTDVKRDAERQEDKYNTSISIAKAMLHKIVRRCGKTAHFIILLGLDTNSMYLDFGLHQQSHAGSNYSQG